jgi:3-oxoacyl-[acyl-carrier protein] reductase
MMETGNAGRLAGKTVVVTGAAHGIGRAYAERFAAEGARLALCDLDADALEQVAGRLRTTGSAVLTADTDVRDYEAVRSFAGAVRQTFGHVDGLVNNAGMLNVLPISRARFDEITEAEWDLVFDENIKSVWHVCRAFVPLMRGENGGSIVNVASSTVFKATETRSHYVASKAAVIGFSRVLSRELGGDWIRVNCVAPGSTLSEENVDEATLRLRSEPIATRSLKRIERPEDVVGTVLFLLSDDSRFMTGQTLIVEGGGIVR